MAEPQPANPFKEMANRIVSDIESLLIKFRDDPHNRKPWQGPHPGDLLRTSLEEALKLVDQSVAVDGLLKECQDLNTLVAAHLIREAATDATGEPATDEGAEFPVEEPDRETTEPAPEKKKPNPPKGNNKK